TVKHPCAGVVGEHVSNFHRSGKQFNDVGAMSLVEHRIAVPMGCVQVGFATQAQQVPAGAFSLFHGQQGQVGKDKAVDTVLHVALDKSQVVCIHVVGRAEIGLHVQIKV